MVTEPVYWDPHGPRASLLKPPWSQNQLPETHMVPEPVYWDPHAEPAYLNRFLRPPWSQNQLLRPTSSHAEPAYLNQLTETHIGPMQNQLT
jgi:hypothetical protein